MPIFYKAVRPDGFDFHSQTINYAQHLTDGTALPVKTPTGTPRCCTSDVYHASTSKADTLIGGSWPCRLFEVEGEEVAEEENKRGFLTLKVVRELPGWEALGPNGEEVVSLIERARLMTADQIVRLAAAWAATRAAAWAACAIVVRDLITREQFNTLYGPWASVMDE